eukprot:1158019-Pelagomonas_calceolata.AAC.5
MKGNGEQCCYKPLKHWQVCWSAGAGGQQAMSCFCQTLLTLHVQMLLCIIGTARAARALQTAFECAICAAHAS